MEQINDLEGLANYFHGLADGSIEPFSKRSGICDNISTLIEDYISTEFMDEWDEILYIDDYYSKWIYFSGDIYYPVPDPMSMLTPKEAYSTMKETMWTGAYGNLRKDLCLHIAKEIEKLIPVE